MWIADTGEVRAKQDIIHVGKRQLTSEERQDAVKKSRGEKSESGFSQDAVTLELSAESSRRCEEQQLEREKALYQEQAESAKKADDKFADMAKLMEIARRIANGDKVPASDEKKLLEYSPELYQIAKETAMINANKKHKEYDSMFGDEDSGMEEKLRKLDDESESATTEMSGGAEAGEASGDDGGEAI